MAIENSILVEYEERVTKKVERLELSIKKHVFDGVREDNFNSFVDFLEENVEYACNVFLNMKILRGRNMGVESLHLRRLRGIYASIIRLFTPLLPLGAENLRSGRSDGNAFLDSVDEIKKITIYKGLGVAINMAQYHNTDKRLHQWFSDTRVELFDVFKSWLNFKNLFLIIDDPYNQERAFEASNFLLLWTRRIRKLAIEMDVNYEMSAKTNNYSLGNAIKLLEFLLKLDILRRGEFVEDIEGVLRQKNFWEGKLARHHESPRTK